MTEKSQIVTGDALSVLRRISDNYIDCCVTSPPYFGLRDYGIEGQIGLEESPQKYIDRLVEMFREVRRTLRPDGTLWLNIGDSYASTGGMAQPHRDASGGIGKTGTRGKQLYAASGGGFSRPSSVGNSIKRKDLIGIPWLLAFALREDGWYLRQDIIWNKPNAMPESVKDRCTKSHEYIFLLTKSDRYYFDYEAIREPTVGFDNRPPAGSRGAATPNRRRRKGNAKTFRGGGAYTNHGSFDNSTDTERESHGNSENETGLRNRRSVWNVATQGYAKAHFATFPEKLIEPCILAGCRPGGIVLDPFIGSGTTAVVAEKNGRDFIGIDLNPDYTELSRERLFGTQEG